MTMVKFIHNLLLSTFSDTRVKYSLAIVTHRIGDPFRIMVAVYDPEALA